MGGNEPGPDQRVGPVCLNVGLQFVPVVLAVVLDTPALAGCAVFGSLVGWLRIVRQPAVVTFHLFSINKI